ncbi:MAG: 2-phospho-L-lactate transferase [Dehalococcoidia bacterium]
MTHSQRPVVVLAGGVGAASFLEGLVHVHDPRLITVVSNTADDDEFFGLHVSPDIDIVIYTLAGLVHPQQGWGLAGDTFACLDALARLGYDTWFRLGDRDLATHVHRTMLLRQGRTLSDATASIASALGLTVRILPMSDDPVRTFVRTPSGEFPFQEYFVRRRFADPVEAIRFQGAEAATPAPGVLEEIARARYVILAPSNPMVSIGPILAVPGIRQALRTAEARVAAISPIVGGATIKGPADRMLAGLGIDVSPRGVAALYSDFLDVMVIDSVDAPAAPSIRELGLQVAVTDTIMRGPAEKASLAEATLRALEA